MGGGYYEKKITIDNIDENTVLKYSDIYDNIRFVKLETRDDNLIGRIDKIIATNDKFVILDLAIAKKVFVFDNSGKFLNIIGSNGAGPEEYSSPDDIAYDEYNDELLILCHDKKVIMKFKLDGTFVRSIKIDYWVAAISVAGKNSYLIYLNNYRQKDGKINEYNIPPSLFNNSVTPKNFDKAVRGNSNYVFIITVIETESHIVNLFVYKRQIYTCFYSKESGTVKCSALFLNDINSLNSGGLFYTRQGNLLIGYVEPKGFVELQDIISEIKNPNDVKNILSKRINIPSFPFGNGKLRDNYSKAIESSTITLSEEEINFINSINEYDNPIIRIATLKKF
jgi:hypothetical protein